MRMPRIPRPQAPSEGADTVPRASEPAEIWHDSVTIPFLPSSNPLSASTDIHGHGALPTIGQIGRYALKYQIGMGGLGVVYAAHDPLLSRLIAIKTLTVDISMAERDAFNAQFLKEARASAGLSHPNIVTVFDAGISDRKAYIAMELLKGRDLRQLRQEGWRPTIWQAVLIVRRVADALAYAHSKGIVHCDVKPANIFMVGRTQPRVLDFGIARITHQRDTNDVGHIVGGSPYYMSPEQVRQEHMDRRSDVFSLGVVLYELLTSQKPFRGESLGEITHGVLKLTPPAPQEIDPKLPKALSEIVMQAMAKEPGQRFRSARSLSRELRNWLEENPQSLQLEAPPPRQIFRKLGWALAALLFLAAAGGVVWRMGFLQTEFLSHFIGLAWPRVF
jgi:eukaryotic-like serine/threonine-protein kinase